MRSVLIGYAGQPCYGQIFAELGGRGGRGRSGAFGKQVAISSVEVVRPPAHGRFEMIGLRTFRYTPSASLEGWDRIVVRYVIERRGEPRRGRIEFRATTQDYATANGMTPPRDGRGHRRRHGRFR
jgi:hypothetical protein